MVVTVRIEQTNKQTTRQINKQKLNYGTYWQNSLNLHANVLARFSHRSLGMSKEKQCWQYLTISILLMTEEINDWKCGNVDCLHLNSPWHTHNGPDLTRSNHPYCHNVSVMSLLVLYYLSCYVFIFVFCLLVFSLPASGEIKMHI